MVNEPAVAGIDQWNQLETKFDVQGRGLFIKQMWPEWYTFSQSLYEARLPLDCKSNDVGFLKKNLEGFGGFDNNDIIYVLLYSVPAGYVENYMTHWSAALQSLNNTYRPCA